MKKILIIEDDVSIAEVTSIILSQAGYDACFVLDGREASKVIQEVQPDLLILDVQIVGVDGRHVCREVKSNSLFKDLPVLMFSASANVKNSVLEAGADSFISKPFDMYDLISQVQALID